MKYLGRRFTSVYILPIYTPVMPTPVVMIPPINQRETSMEVHPCIVLPWKCSTKAKIIIMMAINVMVNPMKVMKRKGATEKEVIPSMLKLSIFVNGYFDSPASRAFLS